MARRTKEDAEKTRTALLDAAEWVFLERGVRAASLNEIAVRAGLTRGAVYWHFDNKESLFQAMHERVKLPMDAMFEEVVRNARNPLSGLKEICVYALRNLARDEHAQRVYTIMQYRYEQVNELGGCTERQRLKRTEVLERSKRLLESAREKGQLHPGIEPAVAALSLHAYINGLFNDFLRNPGAYDLDALAPVFMNTFFEGLEAGAARSDQGRH